MKYMEEIFVMINVMSDDIPNSCDKRVIGILFVPAKFDVKHCYARRTF